MILSYDNDKGDMYELKIDLAFTTFKEGHVKIEKDFGYKVNIFNTTRQTEIDPETGEETNRVSAQERNSMVLKILTLYPKSFSIFTCPSLKVVNAKSILNSYISPLSLS